MVESITTLFMQFSKELGEKLDDLRETIHAVEKASATSTRVDNIRMELLTEREERHKLDTRMTAAIAAVKLQAEVEIAKIRSFVSTASWLGGIAIVLLGGAWALFTYLHPHP